MDIRPLLFESKPHHAMAARRGTAEERTAERQGLIAGFEHRNYQIPRTGRAVIFLSRHRPANYGNTRKQPGFPYDVLSMVNCR
ncbi:hypothetical protein WBP06_17825 [Novosphingobium sp. BL-8H]|uniref:hypothetical protein n=1 Tax=Novosphingobium sp. BL-8H TaxID=3127640 RepID=UPI0037565B77